MQESETEEFSPLSGRRISSSSRMGVIPWIIFSSILVFSFFAFVFATASFAATTKLNAGVNNNIYNNQGGLIEVKYSPGPSSASFEAGTVLSFCDSQNNVCPGLGPIWSQTLAPTASWTPAIAGRLVQLSADLAVYAWVPSSSPNVIYVTAIRTSTAPPAFSSPFFANISLSDPVDYLVLKAYNAQSFVIAYDIHNSSYLIGGTVTPTSSVQLGPPIAMFSIPTTNDAFEIDVVVLSSTWILVSYGQNYVGASFLGYTLSGNSLSPITVVQNGYGLQIINQLSSLDLGASGSGNYFFQATGHIATLGAYSFAANTLTLSNVKTISFPGNVIYQTVEALYLFNGFIILYGVQTESLDVPLTISLVLQWATTSPYITAFFPSNLLETQDHQPQSFQISSCYIPSSSINEPGELFFSYVDAGSDKAKLIRAKIALTTASDVQILPSPPIDISTFKYTHFGKSTPPLVSCPTSAGVLVAYQYVGTFFSSFVWAGGYRFAGIAQEAYVAGSTTSEVRVLRQGISTVHQNLQPGFSYYFSNSGQLLPHISLTELFSPTSFSIRIGVAISDSELLLDPNVFEIITRGNL